MQIRLRTRILILVVLLEIPQNVVSFRAVLKISRNVNALVSKSGVLYPLAARSKFRLLDQRYPFPCRFESKTILSSSVEAGQEYEENDPYSEGKNMFLSRRSGML